MQQLQQQQAATGFQAGAFRTVNSDITPAVFGGAFKKREDIQQRRICSIWWRV